METSSADEVYAEVRRTLREGVAPGTPFYERNFAAVGSRSHSPVREAFVRARAEGLLTRRPKRGLATPDRSPELLEQLWACLAGLEEILVARLAALGVDLSALEEYMSADDDLAFHRALGGLLSHEPVGHLHALAIARLEQDPDSLTEHVIDADMHRKAHRDIVDAIQAAAGPRASELAREHIDDLAAASTWGPPSPLHGVDGRDPS